MKFHLVMKLVPGRNHPCLGEMSLTVYTFLPRWNFIPGWTHPCQKERDEILSRDEKKKKRRVNTSFWDEILKWEYFFLNFWRMYSNMLSKVNVFEHNESMNIMKRKRMRTTSKKSKIIVIISITFFVKFRKDQNFLLL